MNSALSILWFAGCSLVGLLWVIEAQEAKRFGEPWRGVALFAAVCLGLAPVGLVV